MDPAIIGIPWKKQLWHKWKTLRNIPFRKSWFVGYDLEGNSYWEMIDHNNPHRLRRKVSLDRPYFHFSDFKPHPMWMQWLQFTRPSAPSLNDLVNDAKRQHRLKLLAQQAEEKWKSVPLKDSIGGNTDPRLDTAWSGGLNTPKPAEPQRNDDQLQSHFQKVIQEVENRKIRGPKVVRDELGQVKLAKEPKKGEREAAQSVETTFKRHQK